ncbi:MAG: glycosyltransferase family 4 protein [Pyrinomonadaceae bacterium]|nr:glycosyltransferase family 4 protein [Pyrinomonadaceae bacterium]
MAYRGKGRGGVLFLTPGASINGGNVFLLRFLQWLKANTDIPFSVFFETSGDVEAKFMKLGNNLCHTRTTTDKGNLLKILGKAEEKSGIRSRILKKTITKRDFALIYSNTVINHKTFPLTEDLGLPVLTHCHEMESVINLTGKENFELLCDRTDRFIAVSNAVKSELVSKHGIDDSKVEKIYGFVPVSEFDSNLKSRRGEVLESLGFPRDAFLVGASGLLEWRKAPEIFISIAERVTRHYPELPIYFVWVGGADKNDHSLFCADFDVTKLGLSERVKFLPHCRDPERYFAALDLFALVSREDPFPLVCLESAVFDVPILCFDNAGGMPEFVEQDCGAILPYLDVAAFAAKIVELFKNRELRLKLGRNAGEKVRKHHDVEVIGPQILSQIEKMIV